MRPNRVIEGSIHGFLRVLEHALESEELTRRAGLLQSLDPRVKLLGFLGLIVATAASRRLEVIGAIFALASVLAVCSRVPLRTLVVRIWAGAFAFTGLIALPALFFTPGRSVGRLPWLGWVVTAQGVRGALYLISRVETTATLSMLLVLCTPWTHVLKALRVLRVPVVLVVILGMTYRYLFVILETALDMFESRKSRTVGTLEGSDKRRLATATVGVLLSKSYQLSSDVHLAMQSRGFRGEVYMLDDFEMHRADWGWMLLFFTVAATVVWVGR